DVLFRAAVDFLATFERTKLIIVPRRTDQAKLARKLWPHLCAAGKLMILEHVVDGLNLIWHSDLVISGGGTMNREAAALGVPVYSTFRGEIGAVDRYLSDRGRLVLLESVQDLQSKIQLVRRSPAARSPNDNDVALSSIVNQVVAIAGTKTPVSCRDSCLG